ncbi:MAG TPA: hypothetical protein VFV38_07900, partial [Ktedonobacteraceae bacterium]|nr:hypothetical protein [Ktedonobacteraceae bacterium]
VVKTGDSHLLIQEVQIGNNENQLPTWRAGTRLGLDMPTHLLQLTAKVASLEEAFQQRSGKQVSGGQYGLLD